MLALEDIAQRAAQQLEATGGITINLQGVEPTQGYAYGGYAELERILPAQMADESAILQYINDTQQALAMPSHYLGIWHDTQSGNVFLDVSIVSPPGKEALQDAKDRKQIAVWDIGNNIEIPTGVTLDRNITSRTAADSDLHQRVLAQNAGRNLMGLPGPVNVPGVGPLQFHAHGDIQRVADEYNQQAGLGSHPTDYAKVNPEHAAGIAQEYEMMQHNPHDPQVAHAYDALARETKAQYDHAVKNGYQFEFYPDHDPYPNSPREAVLDLHHNKHMFVYPTETGYGMEGDPQDHPMLGDSGVRWNGKPVTHNDLFRAVHDFYGHAKEGLGFRADGEDNAYRQHAAMFSRPARAALASETRGQNSWVNYGPHAEHNQTATSDTIYAPQKAGLMPDWTHEPDLHKTASFKHSGLTHIPSQREKRVGVPGHETPFLFTKEHVYLGDPGCEHYDIAKGLGLDTSDYGDEGGGVDHTYYRPGIVDLQLGEVYPYNRVHSNQPAEIGPALKHLEMHYGRPLTQRPNEWEDMFSNPAYDQPTLQHAQSEIDSEVQPLSYTREGSTRLNSTNWRLHEVDGWDEDHPGGAPVSVHIPSRQVWMGVPGQDHASLLDQAVDDEQMDSPMGNAAHNAWGDPNLGWMHGRHDTRVKGQHTVHWYHDNPAIDELSQQFGWSKGNFDTGDWMEMFGKVASNYHVINHDLSNSWQADPDEHLETPFIVDHNTRTIHVGGPGTFHADVADRAGIRFDGTKGDYDNAGVIQNGHASYFGGNRNIWHGSVANALNLKLGQPYNDPFSQEQGWDNVFARAAGNMNHGVPVIQHNGELYVGTHPEQAHWQVMMQHDIPPEDLEYIRAGRQTENGIAWNDEPDTWNAFAKTASLTVHDVSDRLYGRPMGHHSDDKPFAFHRDKGIIELGRFGGFHADHWKDNQNTWFGRTGQGQWWLHGSVTPEESEQISHALGAEPYVKQGDWAEYFRNALGKHAAWNPGVHGKGLVDQAGRVHTWETDGRDGFPSHADYVTEHKLKLPIRDAFEIGHDGSVLTYDFDTEALALSHDPRLKPADSGGWETDHFGKWRQADAQPASTQGEVPNHPPDVVEPDVVVEPISPANSPTPAIDSGAHTRDYSEPLIELRESLGLDTWEDEGGFTPESRRSNTRDSGGHQRVNHVGVSASPSEPDALGGWDNVTHSEHTRPASQWIGSGGSPITTHVRHTDTGLRTGLRTVTGQGEGFTVSAGAENRPSLKEFLTSNSIREPSKLSAEHHNFFSTNGSYTPEGAEPWVPGRSGKGHVGEDNRVYAWATDEFDSPHHGDIVGEGPLGGAFEITPDGVYDGWNLEDEDHQLIQQAGLKWSGDQDWNQTFASRSPDGTERIAANLPEVIETGHGDDHSAYGDHTYHMGDESRPFIYHPSSHRLFIGPNLGWHGDVAQHGNLSLNEELIAGRTEGDTHYLIEHRDDPELNDMVSKTLGTTPQRVGWENTFSKVANGLKLWVDDERPAPEGWDHAKTVEEAMALMSAKDYDHVSLDHDMGHANEMHFDPSALNGHDLAHWMAKNGKTPSTVIHSWNPEGAANMHAVLPHAVVQPFGQDPSVVGPGHQHPLVSVPKQGPISEGDVDEWDAWTSSWPPSAPAVGNKVTIQNGGHDVPGRTWGSHPDPERIVTEPWEPGAEGKGIFVSTPTGHIFHTWKTKEDWPHHQHVSDTFRKNLDTVSYSSGYEIYPDGMVTSPYETNYDRLLPHPFKQGLEDWQQAFSKTASIPVIRTSDGQKYYGEPHGLHAEVAKKHGLPLSDIYDADIGLQSNDGKEYWIDSGAGRLYNEPELWRGQGYEVKDPEGGWEQMFSKVAEAYPPTHDPYRPEQLPKIISWEHLGTPEEGGHGTDDHPYLWNLKTNELHVGPGDWYHEQVAHFMEKDGGIPHPYDNYRDWAMGRSGQYRDMHKPVFEALEKYGIPTQTVEDSWADHFSHFSAMPQMLQHQACPKCGGMWEDIGDDIACARCGYSIPYDGGEALEGHHDPFNWAMDNFGHDPESMVNAYEEDGWGPRRFGGIDGWKLVTMTGARETSRKGRPFIANEPDRTIYVGPDGGYHGSVYDNMPNGWGNHWRGIIDHERGDYYDMGPTMPPEAHALLAEHGLGLRDDSWEQKFGAIEPTIIEGTRTKSLFSDFGSLMAMRNGERPLVYHIPSNTVYIGKEGMHHADVIAEHGLDQGSGHMPADSDPFGWASTNAAGTPKTKDMVYGSIMTMGNGVRRLQAYGGMPEHMESFLLHKGFVDQPEIRVIDNWEDHFSKVAAIQVIPHDDDIAHKTINSFDAHSGHYEDRPFFYMPHKNEIHVGPPGGYHGDLYESAGFPRVGTPEGSVNGRLYDNGYLEMYGPAAYHKALNDQIGLALGTHLQDDPWDERFAKVGAEWNEEEQRWINPKPANVPMVEPHWQPTNNAYKEMGNADFARRVPVIFDGTKLFLGNPGDTHSDISRNHELEMESGHVHPRGSYLPKGGFDKHPGSLHWFDGPQPKPEWDEAIREQLSVRPPVDDSWEDMFNDEYSPDTQPRPWTEKNALAFA